MEVPDNFYCPITRDVMRDPVITAAGQTYDRAAIEAWFALGRSTDPLTRAGLANTTLTPNIALRGAIEAFLDSNKALAQKLAQLESLRRKVEAQPTAKMQRFLDPITFCIMREPVRAEDGCIYDRGSIERWIADCTAEGKDLTSPGTGQTMGTELTAEEDLQKEIEALWSKRLEAASGEPEEDGDQQVASVQELCRIFRVLDQVEDVLEATLGEWEPPRIVVLGAENSGKSTLLERLCLLPLFPHDKKICTRMAVRVSIRRSPVQMEPTLEVWDVANKRPVGDLRTIPLASSETAIKDEMARIIRETPSASGVGVDLEHELRVCLISPHLPPMNLVDLPGLVENPPATKEQTRRLAERYMTAHTSGSLFLVVLTAESNPNTSSILAMVKERGLEARAVGVFTKCDRLRANDDDEEDFERLHDLLLGTGEASVKLEPHGYVATSNKRVKATANEGARAVLLRQARSEVKFFNDEGFEDDVRAGRATTQGLMNKINTMYMGYLRETWLPGALSRLRTEVWACNNADRELGLPASPGDLQGELLQQLHGVAVAAAQAATASWLDSFSQRLGEEVLQPLQMNLTAMLSEARKGIPFGGEHRAILDAQDKDLALATGTIEKLETLAAALPKAACSEGPSSFKLARFPGLTAKLHKQLRTKVCGWDDLVAQVRAFLKKALNPAGALDIDMTYNVAKRPYTVDITLPAARITSIVLFLVSKSVGGVTAEAMEDSVKAICAEQFAAGAQEVEACHSERQKLRRRREELEAATRHLWQLKVGGGDPPVQEMVAAFLAQESPQVQAAKAAVELLNPAESARSYSSVFTQSGSSWGNSHLDAPSHAWIPGPGALAQPGAEWAQLDLGRVLRVAGVMTQGYSADCVTQYEVHVSSDSATFQLVAGGPFHVDPTQRASARFPAAVEARYVRMSLTRWQGWPRFQCGVLVEK